MNKVLTTTKKINFPNSQVWIHKDGREELLVEMSDNRLINIIYPEAYKRFQQKHYGAKKMAKLIDAIVSILTDRGVKLNVNPLPVEVKANRKNSISEFTEKELIQELQKRKEQNRISVEIHENEVIFNF
jgi:hypothetical protein